MEEKKATQLKYAIEMFHIFLWELRKVLYFVFVYKAILQSRLAFAIFLKGEICLLGMAIFRNTASLHSQNEEQRPRAYNDQFQTSHTINANKNLSARNVHLQNHVAIP